MASTFVKLQQSRHEADYDPAARFTKTQVEALLQDAKDALDAWAKIRRSDEAHTYLTALLAERSWKR